MRESVAPPWHDLYGLLPPELRHYQPACAWDRERLRALDLPVEQMTVAELDWQLSLPWWRDGDRYFGVSPNAVALDPQRYPEHYARTLRADLSFPIDVMLRRGRWLILDGVHRLLKAVLEAEPTIAARKVPADALPRIAAR